MSQRDVPDGTLVNLPREPFICKTVEEVMRLAGQGGYLFSPQEVRIVCEYSAALQAERDGLAAELSMVDQAITRRPALADVVDRYTAICRACHRAGEADVLAIERDALRAENERLKAPLSNEERLAFANAYYDDEDISGARAAIRTAETMIAARAAAKK